MRYLLYIFFTLFCSEGFSQDSSAVRKVVRSYIDLKTYKEKGDPLTKQDTIDFMIRGEDTLVLVPNEFINDLRHRNGVRVRYEPKDSLFLETYKKIVFGNKENSKATLKIWKEDIKIYFDTSVPKLHRTALMDFAEGLSADIDSLNIEKVNVKAESNYLVYYINDENDQDFEPRITQKTSGYYVTWNGRQQLIQASLKVNTTNIKAQNYQIANLKSNFIKTLGYFGVDPSINCNSYFSNCPMIRNFTSSDMEILKYHYSYGICKGTTREDFEDLHSKMKKTLKNRPDAELFIMHTP
ncbi:hypothetical protein [Gillisia sp. JM1]|uniref:hypothetical protein n=1 Tax=Gillisia sp. JM1 TaxID=1283286 RepID=UPI000404662F|nr:hypothetical protein [Gillisia sp. JM1]